MWWDGGGSQGVVIGGKLVDAIVLQHGGTIAGDVYTPDDTLTMKNNPQVAVEGGILWKLEEQKAVEYRCATPTDPEVVPLVVTHTGRIGKRMVELVWRCVGDVKKEQWWLRWLVVVAINGQGRVYSGYIAQTFDLDCKTWKLHLEFQNIGHGIDSAIHAGAHMGGSGCSFTTHAR